MSDDSNVLKVGTAAIVLRMLEDPSFRMRDITLESPIRAIREISLDTTGRRPVRLSNGREMSALDIQTFFLEHAEEFAETRGLTPEETDVLALWRSTVSALESDPDSLGDSLDWAIKRRVITAFAERHSLPLDAPEVLALDLQYHDIDRDRGVFNLLARRGAVRRSIPVDDVESAKSTAPQHTRARLRGEFLRNAREAGRDVTVDWVHLKINDQAQRTVACKDPFRSMDDRVDKLIGALRG
jgi:proteasome accessory factor A